MRKRRKSILPPDSPVEQPNERVVSSVREDSETCSGTAEIATRSAAITKPTTSESGGHSFTEREEREARQRAELVIKVVAAAKADKIPEPAALALVDGKLGKVTYPSYRRWKSKIKNSAGQPDLAQWPALVDTRGRRRYKRPGPDAFWEILRKLYEHSNRLDLESAHTWACRAWRKALEADPDLGQPPTYQQAWWYYKHHADKRAVYLAREGKKAHRDAVVGYITREAPPRDQGWEGDHHVMDVPVRVWDAEKTKWVPVRPWLTAWKDPGSGYMIGWHLRCEYPDRNAIERSLRHALERNGGCPPQIIYIDNGKDYQSFAGPANRKIGKGKLSSNASIKRALDSRTQSVATRLGCETRYALPYNARAKTIERSFKDVTRQFAKMWSGYRGGSIAERPAESDGVWKDAPETLPTLEELSGAFASWVDTCWHEEPSQGKACKGKSPAQSRADQSPYRPALDPLTIYKAFLRPVGERTVHRGGVVLWNHTEYRSDALIPHVLGPKVHLRLDPDDHKKMWIFDAEGREICCAGLKPTLGHFADPADPKTAELLKEEQRRQRRETKRDRELGPGRRREGALLAGLVGARTRGLPDGPATAKAPIQISGSDRPASNPEHDDLIDDLDDILGGNF